MVRRILLAEDSPTIQKVFELALAGAQAALTVVDNGEDAVRLAAELAPDLVVADVTLPGRDGFEVAAALSGSEKTKKCPVLILAGTLSPFDEGRFRGSGAKGVLFKPFEAQELLDKVEELLSGRQEEEPAAKEETAPAAEPWDFSDVLEEIEAEEAVPAPRGADLGGGVSGGATAERPPARLEEFDVSLEEIEAERGEGPVAAGAEVLTEAEAKEAEAVAPLEVHEHLEGSPSLDAPPAVTDLAPALEEVEQLEEIEELEEVDLLAEAAGGAPAEREEQAAPPPPSSVEKDFGEAVVPAAPQVVSRPPSSAAEDASGDLLPADVRERFAARAEEIFQKVAAEAVEKVMWEWMDRLSGEFSARIRESVEAVAWEVIPATAETLIREEIARIRARFEEKSSSSR